MSNAQDILTRFCHAFCRTCRRSEHLGVIAVRLKPSASMKSKRLQASPRDSAVQADALQSSRMPFHPFDLGFDMFDSGYALNSPIVKLSEALLLRR